MGIKKSTLEHLTSRIRDIFEPFGKDISHFHEIRVEMIIEIIKRVHHIPPEWIVMPPYYIIEVIKLLKTYNDNMDKKELIYNYLSKTIDPELHLEIHPGFIDIIKNISNDEIKILKYITELPHFPQEIALEFKDPYDRYTPGRELINNFQKISKFSAVKHIHHSLFYLENLMRLKILDIKNIHTRHLKQQSYFGSYSFERINNQTGVFNIVAVTDFGVQFIRNCIINMKLLYQSDVDDD